MVGKDGELLRTREPGEGTHLPCANGCPAHLCAREQGPPRGAALDALVSWRRCGGLARTTLPRAGGWREQDALEAFLLRAIDGFAEERLRADRETKA